ncbi:hypothetical protein FACS1894177_03010 [Bacteroidia bacterium]|nr:hypothetical protein FACS1894177_03010 [Bacteroidia bacterium]
MKKMLFIYLSSLFWVGGNVILFSQQEGTQRLKFGSIDKNVSVPAMNQTSFFLSGKKMYEIGLMNGSFSEDDDRTVERGIWCHPMKLLDGFGFQLSENGYENWMLTDANTIDHNFYSAKLFFAKNNLSVTREDFVVEEEQALFSAIRIENTTSVQREITLSFSSKINVRPSWRAESIKDEKDSIFYSEGLIIAFDNQGALTMGSKQKPSAFSIEGNNITLTYSLELPTNSNVEILFLIAGDNRSMGNYSSAYNTFNRLSNNYASIKKEKRLYYEKAILQGVNFKCSDEKITDAFYCAKANMVMNTRDAKPFYNDMYFAAGVPVYPRLFGTDFCFSAAGTISAGFDTITRSTLNNILDYTKQHLRGPHEIGSDGKLLGWDHVQVGPQFVAASWEYYAWTKDREYLELAYPVCKQMIEDLFKTADDDHDLYIQGHGLMEEQEFQGDWEELTTSAYMYPALECLSNMAALLNEPEVARQYKNKATIYKKNFNRDWWDDKKKIWPSALSNNNKKEFGNFWSVAFPQKTKLANDKHGQIAMNYISDHWINNTWGMVGKYTPGEDITNAGVGVVHNNICATAAFNYGHTNLGWKLIKLAAKAPFDLPHFQLGLFPECQPHGCSNISQLWSYAPFIESILQGLIGINSVGLEDRVEIFCHIPDDLEYLSTDNIMIGDQNLSISWEKQQGNKIAFKIKSSIPDRSVLLRIPLNKSYSVILNGKKVKLKHEKYCGSNTGTYLIKNDYRI